MIADTGRDNVDAKTTDEARAPTIALAKAIWREQSKTSNTQSSPDERLNDWRENGKEFAALARRILKRLHREGFELVVAGGDKGKER